MIKRNTKQNQSLIEFCEEFINSKEIYWQESGKLMLNWLNRIEIEIVEVEIWVLTSHFNLVLQSKDDYSSENYVVITTKKDEYHIEYLIPKEKEPWENAYVKGGTKSLKEAMKMLKTAIINSNGWKQNK